MKAFDVLLSFVRYAMFGEEISPEIKASITNERLRKLYKLSAKHDIAHLVAYSLEKSGMLTDPELSALFIGERDKAVFRYRLLQRELDDLSRVLSEEGISYMPLKGSVIRGYYPDPWMRTSCDVDVLVKREDLDKAKLALETKLGYTFKEVYTEHDISLFAPSGMHIELHYDLLDDDRRGEDIIATVWEDSYLPDSSSCCHLMSHEMFYFYHVVHMANHFRHGGCGARTLLDLYILNQRADYDRARVESMLARSGFAEFESAMRNLSEVWFGSGEKNPFLTDVESYILSGGVYGNQDNRIAIQQSKSGGRAKYLLSRVFISNKALTKKYPILERRPYLIPWYHLKRWFKLIFDRNTKENAISEISKASAAEKSEDRTAALLRELNI